MKLKDLLAEQRALETEIAASQEALQAVQVLIARTRQRDGLPPEVVPTLTETDNNGKQKRTRGILKAAKDALDMMADGFTRSQFFRVVETTNPSLEGKIRPEAMRGTFRTLLKDQNIEATGETSAETGEPEYRKAING